MPNRVIREGIIDSDRVNKLSWSAEVFYRRLFSVVDDYGCYDGRHSILRSRLFPLRMDKVSLSDVEKWMGECSEAGLVRCYEQESKPYLEIIDFGQTIRIKRRKYPPPPGHAQHMQADDTHVRLETNPNQSRSESGDGNGGEQKTPASPLQRKGIDDLIKSFKADERWVETACMKVSKTKEEIFARLDDFKLHLETSKDTLKTEIDFAKHFFNWLIKQNSNQNGRANKSDAQHSSIKKSIQRAEERERT